MWVRLKYLPPGAAYFRVQEDEPETVPMQTTTHEERVSTSDTDKIAEFFKERVS